MQEQPICPECGGGISDYYLIFQLLRTDRIKQILQEKDVDISQVDISQTDIEDKLDLSDIFESIGFTNICCRTHITSAKDFHDYVRTGNS